MLDDALLIEQSERAIREEGLNAEWALRRTVEKIKEVFDRADDDYFRERRSDVDFVGERVLRQLMGAPMEIARPLDLHGPVVLVAHGESQRVGWKSRSWLRGATVRSSPRSMTGSRG